jgi:hypothetical protein
MRRIVTTLLVTASVLLSAGTVAHVQPVAARGPRQVYAYYFGWYTAGSWGDGRLVDHPVTPYSSSDAGTVNQQVSQAQGAGIDAFIMSWFGPKNGNLTDGVFNELLDISAAHGFHAAASVDMQEGGYNASTGEVLDSLRNLINGKVNHPGYLRYNGKPIIYFWNENRFSTADWVNMRSQVDPSHSTIWVMEGTNTDLLHTFDGLYLFNIAWSGSFAGTAGGWMSKTYGAGGTFYTPTVMPGWDESRISGRTNPTAAQNRDDNQFLINSWNGAISSGADTLLIVSWNEYLENSYIEPSQKLGTAAIDTLRPLIARWKGGSNALAPATNGQSSASNPNGSVSNPNNTPTPLPATGDWQGKRITPTVDNLFVRSGAGTNYKIIDTAHKGEVYAVTGKPNNFWFQIDFKGQTGFVYATNVTFAP